MTKKKREKPSRIMVVVTGEANKQVLAQLEQHGCHIETRRRCVYRITLPAGTVRRFYLRISRTDRYHLILPDGLILTELVTYRMLPRTGHALYAASHALYVPGEQEKSAQADKLTFRHLYLKHEIHLGPLAQAANVPLHILSCMMEGQPVPEKEALRVLETLSQQAQVEYTLENVSVELLS